MEISPLLLQDLPDILHNLAQCIVLELVEELHQSWPFGLEFVCFNLASIVVKSVDYFGVSAVYRRKRFPDPHQPWLHNVMIQIRPIAINYVL